MGKIFAQAIRVWQQGRKAEAPCFELPAQSKLASALWELSWLSERWVTPRILIGPAGRVKLSLSDEERQAIADQISALAISDKPKQAMNFEVPGEIGLSMIQRTI